MIPYSCTRIGYFFLKTGDKQMEWISLLVTLGMLALLVKTLQSGKSPKTKLDICTGLLLGLAVSGYMTLKMFKVL
jgi:hypothetical protein